MFLKHFYQNVEQLRLFFRRVQHQLRLETLNAKNTEEEEAEAEFTSTFPSELNSQVDR